MIRSTAIAFARLAASITVITSLALPAHAANGTWTSNGNGNWSDTGRWASGIVANGVDAVANLGNVISANRTITLNSARTVGSMLAQDTSADYRLVGPNALTLDVTTGLPILDVVAGRTFRIDTVIAGTDGLQKTGAGTLRLDGTNTYTGGTTLSAGTLNIRNTSALGSTSNALTVNAGTLSLQNNSITVGNLTGTGGAIQGSAAGTRTLTIGQGNNGGGNFQGVIANGTGTTALTKTGTATITLSGANTYTGTTLISAGTLQIGNGGTTGSLSTSSAITNNGRLAFSRTNTITQGTNFASVIAGTGGVTKLSTGTLILSGANTYTGTTLINAGTLQIGNAGTTGSLSTSSAITNNGTLAFSRTNTITQGTNFASVIAGTGGVTKLSTGTLVLNGANTYTGATLVSGGTLQAGAAASGQAFGNLSAVTMANVAGATLNLNGFSQTIGSLAGGGTTGGNVALGSGGATLTFGGDNTSTVYGGVISGTGNITKVGTGTFSVTNTSTLTGTATVNAGTLSFGNGGASGSLGPFSTVFINTNGAFSVNRSDTIDQNVASVWSGPGSFLKRGTGTLTMLGTNTYAGGTTVDGGTLRIANAASIGSTSGTLTVNAGGTLDLNNFNTTVGNLTGTGGTITSSVAGNRTLTIGQGNTGGGNYQGVIANGTGTTAVTKTGTGTITLSGANTYSGGTTVSGGTLRANNSSGSATGTGAVAVNAGGTLGGTGSIAGALSINAGGTLSPGASIETLASGPLTFNNNSTFDYEVDSSVALGVAADLLLVSGNLTNSGTVNLALDDIAGSPVAFAHNTTFTLINYSGTWNGGLFTVDGNAIADGGTFTAGLNTWHLYYTATTGGSNFAGQYVHANYVNVVALPEPGTIVLLVAGGLAGLMLRRRIRR